MLVTTVLIRSCENQQGGLYSKTGAIESVFARMLGSILTSFTHETDQADVQLDRSFRAYDLFGRTMTGLSTSLCSNLDGVPWSQTLSALLETGL